MCTREPASSDRARHLGTGPPRPSRPIARAPWDRTWRDGGRGGAPSLQLHENRSYFDYFDRFRDYLQCIYDKIVTRHVVAVGSSAVCHGGRPAQCRGAGSATLALPAARTASRRRLNARRRAQGRVPRRHQEALAGVARRGREPSSRDGPGLVRRGTHTHTLTHTIRRPAASHAASSAPPNDDHNRARSLSPERGEPGGGKAFEEPLVRERFDFPARDALQAAPPRRLRVGACEVADLDAPRPSLGSTLASSRSTAASGTRSRPPAGSRARSSPRSRCRSARFCGLTVLCLYIYICVCVYLLDRSWSYMWSDIYIMLMSDHSWLIDYIYIC